MSVSFHGLQVPRTQQSKALLPALADEPEWMRLATVAPVPAGAAIFRDYRNWHGSTANLGETSAFSLPSNCLSLTFPLPSPGLSTAIP